MYVEIYMPNTTKKEECLVWETNKSPIRTLSDYKKYIKNQTILSWNTEEIIQKAKSKYLIEYQSEVSITVEVIAKTYTDDHKNLSANEEKQLNIFIKFFKELSMGSPGQVENLYSKWLKENFLSR